jgi:hypothetical protein
MGTPRQFSRWRHQCVADALKKMRVAGGKPKRAAVSGVGRSFIYSLHRWQVQVRRCVRTAKWSSRYFGTPPPAGAFLAQLRVRGLVNNRQIEQIVDSQYDFTCSICCNQGKFYQYPLWEAHSGKLKPGLLGLYLLSTFILFLCAY